MVFENLPLWATLLIGLGIFCFFSIGATIIFVVLSRRRWNIIATIMEDSVPYGVIPTRKDRCRLIAFGDGGEEIYYLKRLKKYKVAYGKKIGAKNICWVIGSDGYWYNASFGNLDKKLLEIGVQPVDRDMRMANSVLRKGIENRYDDRSMLEKWAVPLTIGMLVIAILVQAGGTYLNHREANKGKANDAEIAKAQKETMTMAERVLAAVAAIQNQNPSPSGLVPAT